MAPKLQGVQKSTMINQRRKLLCEYKRDHQGCTQQDLVKWVDKTFNLKVSQGTISNTLKRSSEFLSANFDKGGSSKRHKYTRTWKVVYEWFLQHQELVNITGELIIEKAVEALKLLYPQDSSEQKFSQGWLDKFKLRHGIKSYRRFGESGLVTRKEALQAATILHSFLLQYEKSMPQLLSEMRIFKDKIGIDLKFKKK